MRNETNREARRRRFLPGVTGVAAAAAILVGATGMGNAGAAKPLPGRSQMTLVGTHQWAAQQPTAVGKQLLELEMHDGKVWAGYGDYGANTGPISLAAYDPQTSAGFEEQFVVDSEAVYNLRSTDEGLVAPATDPRSTADYAIGAPWTQGRPLRATHVYDTARTPDGDLWMVGSKGNDAVVWRSSDHAATWTESLRIAPSSGVPGDFLRFYFSATIDDRVYVQATSRYVGAEASSMVFENGLWQTSAPLLPNGAIGWKPQPFGTGFIYHNGGHGNAGNVHYFDGQDVRVIGFGYDVEVVNEQIWLLGIDGEIATTTDLVDWQSVVTAPTDARSLAISDSAVYVGTSLSELWAYTGVSPQEGETSTETPPTGSGQTPSVETPHEPAEAIDPRRPREREPRNDELCERTAKARAHAPAARLKARHCQLGG